MFREGLVDDLFRTYSQRNSINGHYYQDFITTDVIKSSFEKQFIKYETFKNTLVHTYFSNKTVLF